MRLKVCLSPPGNHLKTFKDPTWHLIFLDFNYFQFDYAAELLTLISTFFQPQI